MTKCGETIIYEFLEICEEEEVSLSFYVNQG